MKLNSARNKLYSHWRRLGNNSAAIVISLSYLVPQPPRVTQLANPFSPSPTAPIPRGHPVLQTCLSQSSIGLITPYVHLPLKVLDSVPWLICGYLLHRRWPTLSSGVISSSRDLESPTNDWILAFSCAYSLCSLSSLTHHRNPDRDPCRTHNMGMCG
jgi:hypothetical protein